MTETRPPVRWFHPLMPSEFFRGMFSPKMYEDWLEKDLLAETGTMRSDLKETDTAFIVEAELPGFKKENISVEYKDNRLIYRG